jgi:2,3,4,5-tetrahydropyridine-2,6-dicarboxylate N-succinyltransferase
MTLAETIQAAFAGAIPIEQASSAVSKAIELLDTGQARLAEPTADGWRVNGWLQAAILLYFRSRSAEVIEHGPFTYQDKVPLKGIETLRGVRVVPPATVRYGAFVEPGAVLMPSYVNIGARVGAGTMIDTWATIGSGAQVGSDVHIAGGVGIGGVLEPPGATPVIIEDGAFIGSRVIVTEGVRVGRDAVIGAGVVLTGSTRIIDVTGPEPVEHRGLIPAASVVIPGTRPRVFPAGEYGVACALVIGQRTAATDRKTSLNAALRDFDVGV